MTRLILILLVLTGGVWLALHAFDDSNYVVIGAWEWVIKMSLTVFVALLAIAFVPAYLVVRGLFALWRSPGNFRAWRRDRKDRSAQAMLNHGLALLVEGSYRKAERELVRAVDAGASPMLGYIGAARAAQALGANERRDEYLGRASDAQPSRLMAVGLTRAELHLDQQQREQALATLLQLRQRAPGHGRTLALLRRLFEELEEWDKLLEIVPALKRTRAVTAEEASAIESQAFAGLLRAAADSDDAAALRWRWSTLPKSKQTDSSLLGLYTELMLKRGESEDCEPLIRSALNKTWQPQLVRLYGLIAAADAARQLKRAERWLSGHEDDAELLLCLGRLCVENRLWGKARSYLDASIAIEPRPETFAVLVALLDELGETDTAGEYARRGLQHAGATCAPDPQSAETQASTAAANPQSAEPDEQAATNGLPAAASSG